MDLSKKILLGVGGLVVLLLAWFGIMAASVASEASAVDTYLKASYANHTSQSEMSKKLTSMGFTMKDAPGESEGTGPNHSMLFYSTHLTAKLKFDQDGKNTEYHMDRS